MTLMTIAEAAKAIKMSEGFIRAAIRNGDLKVVRFGKVRGVRISEDFLHEFIAGKIERATRSYDQEMAKLGKLMSYVRQRVTPHD